MNKIITLCLMLLVCSFELTAIPNTLSYQGRVSDDGLLLDGDFYMRFALSDGLNSAHLWHNDGSDPADHTQPLDGLGVTVTNGLFSIVLGNGPGADNSPIPSAVWENDTLFLKVWLSKDSTDGTDGTFDLLTTTQIVPVAHAHRAKVASGLLGSNIDGSSLVNLDGATILAGSIGSSSLAPGSVNYAALGEDAVNASHIAEDAVQLENLAFDELGSGLAPVFEGVTRPVYISVNQPPAHVKLSGHGEGQTTAFSNLTNDQFDLDITGSGFPVVVVPDSGSPAQSISIAEIGGRVAISYTQDNGSGNRLMFAIANDAELTSTTTWKRVVVERDKDVFFQTSLASIGGKPGIAFVETSGLSNSLWFAIANVTDPATETQWNDWEIISVDPSTASNASALAVVDGRAAIAYFDQDRINLFFAMADDANYQAGETWSIEQIDTGDGFSGVSLALINDRAMILYDGGALAFAHAPNSSAAETAANWSKYTIAGGSIFGLSLAEVGGFPAVAYAYQPHQGTLAYTVANKATPTDSSDWLPVVQLDTGSVGESPSLIEVNGQPMVAHHKSDTDDLKVTIRSPIGTQPIINLTLDGSTAKVGESCALAFINGKPVIAYNDRSNDTIKVFQGEMIDWSVNAGMLTGLNLAQNGNLELSYLGGATNTVDMSSVINDADADPTNEIQNLSYNTSTMELSLTSATSVNLSSLVDDADSDPANEIITNLQLDGTQLRINEAGNVRTAELSSLINDADFDPANEIQVLSFNTSTAQLSLGNGGGTADLSQLEDDADADPANELITGFSFDGSTLTVNEAGVGHKADLSSLVLGDLSSPDSSLTLMPAGSIVIDQYTGDPADGTVDDTRQSSVIAQQFTSRLTGKLAAIKFEQVTLGVDVTSVQLFVRDQALNDLAHIVVSVSEFLSAGGCIDIPEMDRPSLNSDKILFAVLSVSASSGPDNLISIGYQNPGAYSSGYASFDPEGADYIMTSFMELANDGLVVTQDSITAQSFVGDGASLTNLDGGNVQDGTITAAKFDSNIVFTGDGSGLTNLNPSNLAGPFTYNSLDFSTLREVGIGDANGGQARKVFVSGNYAYVANWLDGLRIYDISDPTNPQSVGHIDDGNDTAQGIVVTGNYAYLSADDDGVRIYDVSDPTNPTFVRTFPMSPSNDADADQVTIEGNYAYLANGSGGLQIYDISDPSNPVLPLGGSQGYEDTNGGARRVAINGNYAYLPLHGFGFAVMDITNKSDPVKIRETNFSGTALAIEVTNSHLYVGDSLEGVRVYNLVDPANPAFVTTLDDSVGGTQDIKIVDNYAYVARTGSDLRIYDIIDPTNPVRVATIAQSSGAIGLAVEGNYIYVANQTNGLRVLEISSTFGLEAGATFVGDASGLTNLNGLHLFDGSVTAAKLADGVLDGATISGVALSGSDIVVTEGGVDHTVDISDLRVSSVGIGLAGGPATKLQVEHDHPGTTVAFNPGDHAAIFRNPSTSSHADVLLLELGSSAPATNQNFITFRGSLGTVGAIKGDGAGGLQFNSSTGDYAEYLPRLNIDEDINRSDVVGVFNGKVSKQTEGADWIMAVSSRAIVLGNHPGEALVDHYEAIGFLGQVEVKAVGPVQAGDYLIASGRNDGTAIAVSPGNLIPAQYNLVIGRAWDESSEPGLKKINTVVGLPQAMVEMQRNESADLLKKVAKQQAEIAVLKEQIDALEQIQVEHANQSKQIKELLHRLSSIEASLKPSNKLAHNQ
ncbi:hypothetical protein [Rubellicoccus peritrichatus]|uniref:LVIVD repeat protein n=1 Tax=Rubellicoccus peritrichatus TaxID=3080537 RepID=A0AAQ3QSF8_9BACT|nr:hypothetical protein [Puniceicoccus sp. CR14]WOO40306.1 hypothetical protein RZN69_16930 [Puniceicoccus sp. CR14]